MIKIIECPRDAMQGLTDFIATKDKIDYINALLQVGFDTIDFGSFVSPKAIPQLKDTVEVVKSLDLTNTNTKLLAIIGNVKGAEQAVAYDEIQYLGFPFSISSTFLKNNINSDISKSLITCNKIRHISEQNNKELLVYISMAFGNPYGDEWSIEILRDWVDVLSGLGVKMIALSDTTGEANADILFDIFSDLIPKYPAVEFGLHMHTKKEESIEKIQSAYKGGCRRFDTVLNGFGGCPMSGKELLQNLNTYDLMAYLESESIPHNISNDQLDASLSIANRIF
jgi:hydroxymethylglutaryl-CoA lyase